MYGKDLHKNIRAEVGGKFEDLLMACMTDPYEFDAKSLRGAMKGRSGGWRRSGLWAVPWHAPCLLGSGVGQLPLLELADDPTPFVRPGHGRVSPY